MPTKRQIELLTKDKENRFKRRKPASKKKKADSKKSAPQKQKSVNFHTQAQEPIAQTEPQEGSQRKPKNYEIPEPVRRFGAPSALNQRRAQMIADSLRGGASIHSACKAAGITSATYGIWIRKGEAGIEPYLTFFSMVEEAKSAYEARENSISEAAIEAIEKKIRNGDANLALKWLMLRRKELFGEIKNIMNQFQGIENTVAEAKVSLTKNDIEILGRQGLQNIVGDKENLLDLIEAK